MSNLSPVSCATLPSLILIGCVLAGPAVGQESGTSDGPALTLGSEAELQSVAQAWGVEQTGEVTHASHLLETAISCPGTLFQWSYGTSFSGGPDLSEPLVTDRPDFTEASSTVGNGVLQIEAGYTYTTDSAGGESTRSHSWGEPLYRYGMFAEWFEWRLALFPVTERTNVSGVRDSTSGMEDIYFGAKIGLTPQEGILPEMTILPQMTIPAGSNAFTSDQVQPGVNWLYSWQLSDELNLAGSTQFNRAVDDSQHAYTEWAQSFATGLSLTETASVYAEWYALFPHSADGAKPEHYLNGGFAVLFGNDVQWDIRAGTGLNEAADDFFAGTGLSVRFH